jgi:hypothetical protein
MAPVHTPFLVKFRPIADDAYLTWRRGDGLDAHRQLLILKAQKKVVSPHVADRGAPPGIGIYISLA